jgi:hypothetical protein
MVKNNTVPHKNSKIHYQTNKKKYNDHQSTSANNYLRKNTRNAIIHEHGSGFNKEDSWKQSNNNVMANKKTSTALYHGKSCSQRFDGNNYHNGNDDNNDLDEEEDYSANSDVDEANLTDGILEKIDNTQNQYFGGACNDDIVCNNDLETEMHGNNLTKETVINVLVPDKNCGNKYVALTKEEINHLTTYTRKTFFRRCKFVNHGILHLHMKTFFDHMMVRDDSAKIKKTFAVVQCVKDTLSSRRGYSTTLICNKMRGTSIQLQKLVVLFC